MSKRHMKRFSTSRVDRGKQIKTPVRCHLTPVRMAVIEKTQRQVSARTGGKGDPRALQMGAAAVGNSEEGPQKVKPGTIL